MLDDRRVGDGIQDVIIRDCVAGAGKGGGIANDGWLSMADGALTSNDALDGGGLYNNGTANFFGSLAVNSLRRAEALLAPSPLDRLRRSAYLGESFLPELVGLFGSVHGLNVTASPLGVTADERGLPHARDGGSSVREETAS